MENLLRFVPMPSLEQMALRRIAVALYSDPRVLSSIAECLFRPDYSFRNIWIATDLLDTNDSNVGTWRQDVEDKMAKLHLPESLRKQMVPILRGVGSEIFIWKWVHEWCLEASIDAEISCLQKLCWTPSAGAVDYERTAERIVNCDALDVAERFELACWYCLQDSIPTLWDELSDTEKRKFWGEEATLPVEAPDLRLFVPRILENESEIKDMCIPAFNSFGKSAQRGSKTLVEFCFGNLTREERADSLVRTAEEVLRWRADPDFESYCNLRKGRLSGVFCYLLSVMTPEERLGIFREQPCEVLRCFMDWPWQDLFSDIADVVWPFIPEEKHRQLLYYFFDSMYSSGYYFPNVIQDLILRSPREFGKSFVDEHITRINFLSRFLEAEDAETVRVVVGSLDAADRVRLVFDPKTLHCILSHEEDWRAVEAFLGAAALSDTDKQRLKNEFAKEYGSLKRKYGKLIDSVEKNNLGRLVDFLGEIGESTGKPERPEHEKRSKTENLGGETKKIRFNE